MVTFTKNGVEMEIEYHYTPYEPSTLDYPGDDESVEITSIKVGEFEILPVVDWCLIEKYEEEIIKHING